VCFIDEPAFARIIRGAGKTSARLLQDFTKVRGVGAGGWLLLLVHLFDHELTPGLHAVDGPSHTD